MSNKLLASNGKPSKLNAEQYKLVRTPDFKKWFGDWEKDPENASKVVDENGEPVVVYHGTKQNFTVFNLDKVGSNIDYGMWGSGFYFSPIKSFSKNYGNVLMKIFLNIKNPFVRNPNLSGSTSQFKPVYGKQESMELRNKILDSNYDGVLQFESGKKNPLTQVVAFYPEQIKLADGSNTAFDSSNNDIRYEYGGNTPKKDNMKKTAINWSEYYKAGGEIPKDIKSKIYDSNGERRIDKKAIQALTDYAENLPQTKDANLERNGEYTASRKKLHQRIINSFKDELVCIQKKEPIAILMGGSPASGKSTFLRKYAPYLLKEEILKVDADEIRAMLPEYKGWNATSTHLETKDIVNTLLSDKTIGIPCKYDVIYDGTMNSTKSYIPLMKLLKELGYKIFIVYIDRVPEEVVKKRALERYKKSGRFVPEAVIDDFFSRGKSALNELKQKADGYMVIDGSDGEYNILEQEGMRLPKRRLYSQLGQPIKKISKK
jgi:predicted ABC-type ATPase